MSVVVGVDGCKAGWIAVLRDLSLAKQTLLVVPTFADVLALKPAMIAVDMPIGLPDRIGPGGRGPERLVRPLLGARQSSVFAIPAREVVEARDYRQACLAALATSDPPRKVSKQAFFLFPKILEIDRALQHDMSLCAQVYEVHPEVAFATMKGGPLSEPKKYRGAVHPPGVAERRALLLDQGLPPALVEAVPPRGAAIDDCLDAIACSWAAERLFHGKALSFPTDPPSDRFGIPIAIRA